MCYSLHLFTLIFFFFQFHSFFFRLSGVLHSCGVLIHRYSWSGTNIVTNEWKLGNKHNIAMASFSYKICHYLLPGRGGGNRRRILERITSFSGETNGGSVSHCWHSVKEGSLKYFRNSGNVYHDTTKILWQPPSPPPRCRCIMTSP